MRPTALLSAVLATLAGAAWLAAEESAWYVGHHPKYVNIQFESVTDLETIIGTANQAKGEIKLDLDKGTGSVSLSVPVASMKTGIDMRDEHMRSEKWLDAAKYPDITFVSKKAAVDKAKGTAQVTGDFTCHGVTKEMTVTVSWKAVPAEAAAKAQFPKGDWVRFTTEFDVALKDYGITNAGGGKVADSWKIRMTMFAGSEKPEEKK